MKRTRDITGHARVPRLGWMAFGSCLVVAGCGASPDASTTSGGELVAQTRQAVTVAADVSLYVLGKCVDVPDFNDTNGTDVQIYDCNAGTNQQWEFWSDGTVRPTFNTNKCLDLPGWETANGTPIQIYDCHGSTNQQWTLSSNGVLQGFGGKCVDDPAYSTTDGTNLQYYDCNGGANQSYAPAPPMAGPSQFWNLKAEESNSGPDESMCMGIAGGVLGSGYPFDRNIIVWDCNGSPDQMWTPTFQSDPSGQSGVVNLVDSSIGVYEGSPFPVCLWNEDVGVKLTAGDTGLQTTTEWCPDQSQYQGGFVFNYVQNDASGYPCYTLQDPQSGLYLGVANAQVNNVQNGMDVIYWTRTGDDQVWCDHVANNTSFAITPQFVVTSVVYSPPGTTGATSSNTQLGSIAYSDTTTVGSSVTTTNGFQNSTTVTATASAGGSGGNSASVNYNHTFSQSDANEVDLTTTWTDGNTLSGQVNGIDHDNDQIWLMVQPVVNMAFTPSIAAGGPPITNWQFGQGDGVNTNVIGYVYAGELDHDMPLRAQTLSLFALGNITSDMYPEILDADAFFQGIAPQEGVSTPRFDLLPVGDIEYAPPPQGQLPGKQVFMVTQATTTSETTTSSYSNSVGFTVSAGIPAGPFSAQLKVSSQWTWTHSSSQKDSTGNSLMDTLTVGQPAYGYNGPGSLHVYEDRIFKTYAFTIDYPGAIPFTDDGANGSPYQCVVGGVEMHCCPPGNVMVGVGLAQNVFKCAPVADLSGPIVADTSTYRNVSYPNSDGTSTVYNMHTCPFGSVMVGLREDMNILACQQMPFKAATYAAYTANAITGEVVDTGTQDSYPMRVCESAPYAYAMSGLDPVNNLLTCATNPGLWTNVGLQILSATYGGDCGAPSGNETETLGTACRGLSTCTYVVDYTKIGDPAPGCGKDYAVSYTCNGGAATSAYLPAEAGFGSVLNLQCP